MVYKGFPGFTSSQSYGTGLTKQDRVATTGNGGFPDWSDYFAVRKPDEPKGKPEPKPTPLELEAEKAPKPSK